MAERPLTSAAARYRLDLLGTYTEQEAAAEDAVSATQRGVLALLTEKPRTARDLPDLLAQLDALLAEQEAALLGAVEAALQRTAAATAAHATPP